MLLLNKKAHYFGIFTICRRTKVHIVDIYGIFGIYSSGGKSRQKARILPNGDYCYQNIAKLDAKMVDRVLPHFRPFTQMLQQMMVDLVFYTYSEHL